ncbi:MAG TPA: hypothetical protein VEL28_08210 [Candidatus Binatia bacterium]|nr:hypothetical protein [Candidatus Binatia bacterium]
MKLDGTRGADSLLLATVAVSESEAVARLERRLRQAAVVFLRTPQAGAREAAARCLQELAEESGAEAAYVATTRPRTGRIEQALGAERGGLGVLGDRTLPALVSAAATAARTSLPFEHPVTDGARVAADTLRELDACGVRALRWVVRPGQRGSLIIVGMHCLRRASYWTPRRQHLHDGLAEILLATLQRTRRGQAPVPKAGNGA